MRLTLTPNWYSPMPTTGSMSDLTKPLQTPAKQETIFIRYRKGTVLPVPPNPAAKIREAADLLDDDGALKASILEMTDWCGWGIAAESTWAQVVWEIMRDLNGTVPTDRAKWVPPIQAYLRQSSDLAVPASDRWRRAKEQLHENIDVLSGWQTSPYRQFATTSRIYRQNGAYFEKRGGETFEIYGSKTALEERADYIAGSLGASYGALRGLVKVFALCNLQDAFEKRPEDFPKGTRVVLSESDHWTTFRHWEWVLRWPYELRPTRWRPSDNYCDPDWLANDMCTFVSEAENLFHNDDHISRSPALHGRWTETFGKSSRQTGFTLETNLRLGSDEEEWLEFRGHIYRWINPTAALCPALVATHAPGERGEDVVGRAFQFISHLSFQTDHGIAVEFWVEGAAGLNPIAIKPKREGSSGYPAGVFTEVRATSKETIDLALSFYREGASSPSPYYAFLNFYKVVYLPGETSQKVKDWINAEAMKMRNLPELDQTELRDTYHGDVERYLRKSSRNAMAHVDLKGAEGGILSPDNLDDQRKIRKDLNFMRELARHAIDSGVF